MDYLSGRVTLLTVNQIARNNNDPIDKVQDAIKDIFAAEVARQMLGEPKQYIPERLQILLKEFGIAGAQPQPRPQELPQELNTDKARALLTKTVEAGFIAVEKGRYKWKGAKVLLAYFAQKATAYLGLKIKGGTYACWKPFEELFAASNLRNARGNWIDKTGYDSDFQPTGYKDIDTLFNALTGY